MNGAQAEVYADHFIAVHLKGIGGGKTYSQLSYASLQDPKNTELAGQVQTVFRGETLRGLLLNAYAFWKLGQIAKLGVYVAFILAGVLALLTILGLWHLSKVAPEKELVAPPVELKRVAAI